MDPSPFSIRLDRSNPTRIKRVECIISFEVEVRKNSNCRSLLSWNGGYYIIAFRNVGYDQSCTKKWITLDIFQYQVSHLLLKKVHFDRMWSLVEIVQQNMMRQLVETTTLKAIVMFRVIFMQVIIWRFLEILWWKVIFIFY